MFVYWNPNPRGRNVGDCTVRAISKATGQSWEETFAGLCVEGFALGDMPSSDDVWGEYIRHLGFHRRLIPNDPDGFTVRDFCEEFPSGTFILALSGHVVAVVDGNYFDSMDSGDKFPTYYWTKEEK